MAASTKHISAVSKKKLLHKIFEESKKKGLTLDCQKKECMVVNKNKKNKNVPKQKFSCLDSTVTGNEKSDAVLSYRQQKMWHRIQ